MIILKVRKLESLKEKSIGLIGKNSLNSVMFNTRLGIHTFGMKFSIDVLILNKRDQVVCYKKNLKPNRIYLWPIKYDKVIELPAGKIDKEKIDIGSKIKIENL